MNKEKKEKDAILEEAENALEEGKKQSDESKRIEELEKLLEEEKNLRLRALADYQNLKNRVEKEREELIQYAQTNLLIKLFEIIDDLKIFLDNEDHADDAWKRGIGLVYQKLLDIVKSEGVEMIPVEQGEMFNSEIHEALTFSPTDSEEKAGTISQVVSNGYRRITDAKTVRSAKVIVFKKS